MTTRPSRLMAVTVLGVLCLSFVRLPGHASQSQATDLPPATLAQIDNLLVGGSFEQGLKGWQTLSRYTQRSRNQWDTHAFEDYQIVTGDALHGNRSLRIDTKEKTTVTLSRQGNIEVFKGCTYSFKVHYKRKLNTFDKTRTTPALRVIFRDKAGKNVSNGGG